MSTEIKPEAIRDQDEAISLSYWLAEKMGEHVDDQGDETLTETVQRYVSREWMPKTEPEPEWKPGTVGTAEVVREGANGGPRVFRRTRGMVVHRPAPIDDDMFVTTEGDLWALEGNYCKNFVPDEPRPLPTREQIATVLRSYSTTVTRTREPGDFGAIDHYVTEVMSLFGGAS